MVPERPLSCSNFLGVVHEYLVDFLKFEVGNPPLPLTRSPRMFTPLVPFRVSDCFPGAAFPPCLRNTQSKYWAVYEKAGQKGGNSQPAAGSSLSGFSKTNLPPGSPYDEDNEPDPKDQHAKQKPKSNPNQKFDDLYFPSCLAFGDLLFPLEKF